MNRPRPVGKGFPRPIGRPRHRPVPRTVHVFILALLALCSSGNNRPPETPRVETASGADIVYRQDFETPGLPVVDYWDLVRDPNHPHYNKVFLLRDTSQRRDAHGGIGCLALRTLGGNTAFQTSKPLIEIDPSRSYRLRAWAMGHEISANKVFVSLRWLDKLGILISEDKSNVVGRSSGWQEIVVDRESVPPDARYVQIRLNMEGEDIRGEARFDDIVLTGQMKIVAETPDRPGNIFAVGEEKRMTFTLPAAADVPRFSFEVRNAIGRVVMPATDETPAASGKSITRAFAIDTPGYYEVFVRASSMESGGGRTPVRHTAEKRVPLIVIEPRYFRKDERCDIGVTIDPYILETGRIPLYVKTLGAEKVKVSLWASGIRTDAQPPDMGEILRLLKALWMEKVQLIGVVSKPSPAQPMGKGLPFVTGGVISLFSLPKDQWHAPFADLVRRTTDYLRFWQIGADDEREPIEHPEAAATLKIVDGAIKEIKSFSRIGIPTALGALRRPTELSPFIAVDTGVADLAAFERLKPRPGEEAHYLLRLTPAVAGGTSIDRVPQMADIVKKCVLARKAGIADVYIPLEGDSYQGLLDNNGLPVATFLCVRTLNKLLSGTTYDDRRLFADSIRDFVFRRGNERIIVLWNDGGEVEKDLYLGDSARIVEPTGAVMPMPIDRPLKIGPLPIFIVNVDSQLMETVLSLRFNDDRLPLSGAPTARTLQFVNKFAVNMSSVKIDIKKSGKGWFVRPTSASKTLLEPGEAVSQEMSFRLPPTEQSGVTDVVIEATFSVDKTYRLKILRQMRLAPELDVKSEFPLKAVSDERSLKLMFSNDSAHVANTKAFIKIPGMKTLEVNFAGLPPKQIKELNIPIPRYAEARGQKITVKFFETNGDLFINREFVIP